MGSDCSLIFSSSDFIPESYGRPDGCTSSNCSNAFAISLFKSLVSSVKRNCFQFLCALLIYLYPSLLFEIFLLTSPFFPFISKNRYFFHDIVIINPLKHISRRNFKINSNFIRFKNSIKIFSFVNKFTDRSIIGIF